LRVEPPEDWAQPFRLPGQFCLGDLPFHYNRFRFFLPDVGRFLTPDPLGLEAGVNLYAGPINPVQCADLLGLCDGEVFYRAMSDAELQAVMKDCKIHNRPESESKCHEAFVTQRKDYSQKLQARHPDKYPNLVEFCCQHGTASAMQNPAISAASNSTAASSMFPNHSRTVKGLTNIIHLKFEQVGSRADQALNYGLRRDSVGNFNSRIKSAKAQPGGQSCTCGG
jgi:RHS repeat-associated protein